MHAEPIELSGAVIPKKPAFKLLGAFAITTGLLWVPVIILAFYLDHKTNVSEAWTEGLKLFGIALVCASALSIVWKVERAPFVAAVVIIGAIVMILGQSLNLMKSIPALNRLPLTGVEGLFHDWWIRDMILYSGAGILFAGSFLSIIDAARFRHDLTIENARSRRMLADVKQAQESLVLQREWFRVTLASIGDGVIATDTKGRITFMNSVAEELTGWRLADAEGRDSQEILKIVNEDTRTPVESPISRVLGDGMISGLASRTILVTKNGTEKPIDDSGAPIRDGEGKLMGVVLVFRDITERRKTEESHSTLAAIVDSSSDAIIGVGLNGEISQWNRAATRIYGYNADEVIGKPVSILFPPERHDELEEILRTIERGEAVQHLETERVGRDGRRIHMSLAVSPIKDAEGRIIGASKIARDITDRKRSEEEIRLQREWFRVTLASIGDAVIATDTEGRVTFMNAVAEQLTGWTFDSAEGRESLEVFKIVNEASRQSVESPIARVLREGAIVGLANHTVLVAKDGSERPIDDSGAPIRGDDGNLMGVVLVFRDITERRKTEEAKSTLASIVESSFDPIIGETLDGMITHWNQAAEQTFGYTEAEIVGKPVTTLFPPERHDELREILAAIGRGEEVRRLETVRVAKDGRRLHMSLAISPIRNSHGEIIGASKMARDVTERRRAEAEIRRQREWFRVTLASIGDAVIATDAEGRVAFMNPIAEQLTGWNLNEAEGRDSLEVFKIVNEETRQTVESPVTRVIREGIIAGLANHTVLIAQNGTEIPIDDSGAPMRTDSDLIGVVLVFRDITQRRRAENSLRESEARFRTLADAAPVLIWIAGTDKKCTYFNRTWLEFTGRPIEEELGDGWAASVHPADLEGCLKIYNEFFDRRETFRMEYRLRRADGEYRWILDCGVPNFDPTNNFVGYIGSCIDITDRMKSEQDLKALAETLEARVAERTAVAEHRAAQLRALAAELTDTEQRERRRLSQLLHDHLQQLLVAAKLKLAVLRGRTGGGGAGFEELEDILKQSIDSARTLTVELSPPILHDAGLVSALPWLASWMEERHGIHVEVEADPKAEPASEEIRVILFEALRELIFNAVKHSQVSEVSVRVAQFGENEIQIVVEDKGVGFDPASMDSGIDSNQRFGLFNLKERLDYVGGSLEIDSALGKGARFIMKAPKKIANGVAPEAAPEVAPTEEQLTSNYGETKTMPPGGNLRVLLVEDHAIVREGIARLLRAQEGIEVVGEVADGLSAISLAVRLQPDVIVMDVSLPRMNGIEATRRIVQELRNVRVIGLSMHRQEDMAASMRAAGAVAYLAKDGPSDQLIATIRGLDTVASG